MTVSYFGNVQIHDLRMLHPNTPENNVPSNTILKNYHFLTALLKLKSIKLSDIYNKFTNTEQYLHLLQNIYNSGWKN